MSFTSFITHYDRYTSVIGLMFTAHFRYMYILPLDENVFHYFVNNFNLFSKFIYSTSGQTKCNKIGIDDVEYWAKYVK